ncbi:unnamed protein product, partial [Prorocentrum cordatum]
PLDLGISSGYRPSPPPAAVYPGELVHHLCSSPDAQRMRARGALRRGSAGRARWQGGPRWWPWPAAATAGPGRSPRWPLAALALLLARAELGGAFSRGARWLPWPTRLLPAELELVVFDLAGTTLDDTVDGEPLAGVAFRDAFGRVGLSLALRRLCRGFPRSLVGSCSDAFVEELYAYWKQAVGDRLVSGDLREIPGTSSAFSALRERGTKVFVSTGFEQRIAEAIVSRLNWTIDGLVAGARRPRPDAIFECMNRTGVVHPGRVLKVGDSVADVEEGRAAGVLTAAVASGTQPARALRSARPDFLLGSVADLPALLPG